MIQYWYSIAIYNSVSVYYIYGESEWLINADYKLYLPMYQLEKNSLR